ARPPPLLGLWLRRHTAGRAGLGHHRGGSVQHICPAAGGLFGGRYPAPRALTPWPPYVYTYVRTREPHPRPTRAPPTLADHSAPRPAGGRRVAAAVPPCDGSVGRLQALEEEPAMPAAPIRVALIEDHGIVRAGIRLVLER